MKNKIRLLLALALILVLLCAAGTAYAAEPITLDVVALDYQTGKPVTKTYLLYNTINTSSTCQPSMLIPKTGDASVGVIALACAVSAAVCYKKRGE